MVEKLKEELSTKKVLMLATNPQNSYTHVRISQGLNKVTNAHNELVLLAGFVDEITRAQTRVICWVSNNEWKE